MKFQYWSHVSGDDDARIGRQLADFAVNIAAGITILSDFKPVEFVEPKSNRLPPLFTSRIANALDYVINGASTVFAICVIFGGLSVLGYQVIPITIALLSRGAWFSLFGIALLVFVFAICFRFSSMVTRMVLVFALAALSLLLAPTFEQLLL